MGSRWLAMLVLVLAGGAWGQGAIDVYTFEDATQEARYKALIDEFRCPKCLNTNLAGSDAPIAQDLRRTVHELVVSGRSDDEVRRHLQDRYGDFVLYDPPVRADTVALWVLPVALLVVALFAIVRLARRRVAEPLEGDERERAARLLEDHQ